jgi:hypothetical protein
VGLEKLEKLPSFVRSVDLPPKNGTSVSVRLENW